MKLKIAVIALLSIVLGCKTNTNQYFDYGKVEGNSYSNNFFNFKVNLPSDWSVQSRETMEKIAEEGVKMITADNKELESLMDASTIKTAQLLGVYKHDIGEAVEFNPSFLCMSENLSYFSGIKSGKEYYYHMLKVLDKTELKYKLEGETETIVLSGEEIEKLKLSIDFLGSKIYQEYYTVIKNGFALSFVVSYINDEQRNELEKIINSVQFKN